MADKVTGKIAYIFVLVSMLTITGYMRTEECRAQAANAVGKPSRGYFALSNDIMLYQ